MAQGASLPRGCSRSVGPCPSRSHGGGPKTQPRRGEGGRREAASPTGRLLRDTATVGQSSGQRPDMAEGAGILPNHEVTHSAALEASGPESPFPSHSRPHPAHHTPPMSTTCPSATARVWGCPAHRRAPPLEDRPGERFATAPEAGPGISERGILGSQVSGMAGNCQIHSCEPRVDPKWTRITRTLVNRFCATSE